MPVRGTSIAAITVALLAGGAARAQDWQEYAYPEAGFSAQFPAKPAVSQLQYQAAGVNAPARLYLAHQGGAEFSVIVADLSSGPLGKDAAIDAAVKVFVADGQIKLDVSERIDRQFGRELSVVGKDGRRSAAAIFFVDRKLYVLAGRTEPAAAGLGVRFQQSLQFIDQTGQPPRRPEDGPGFAGAAEGPGRRRPPPEAFADCKGKAEGFAVQHRTPRGDVVAATCVATPEGLAARPDRPLGGPPGEGPPPEG